MHGQGPVSCREERADRWMKFDARGPARGGRLDSRVYHYRPSARYHNFRFAERYISLHFTL